MIEIKNKLGLGTHPKPSVRGAKRLALHPRGRLHNPLIEGCGYYLIIPTHSR